MRAGYLLTIVVAALGVLALDGAATPATAGRACVNGARDSGYSYAGHQAADRGHGVRATISLMRKPSVDAGHVAGWVGVGGPGQGADDGDAWIQAGIAALPGLGTILYAEVVREGRERELVLIDDQVTIGRGYRIAVAEVESLPGWWQVRLDGEPVTERIRMPGSSGRWAPIVTAESRNAGTACNAFGFRFESVSVSYGDRDSWRPFVSGHRFLDGTHALRDVALAGGSPRYAFVAASTSS